MPASFVESDMGLRGQHRTQEAVAEGCEGSGVREVEEDAVLVDAATQILAEVGEGGRGATNVDDGQGVRGGLDVQQRGTVEGVGVHIEDVHVGSGTSQQDAAPGGFDSRGAIGGEGGKFGGEGAQCATASSEVDGGSVRCGASNLADGCIGDEL